MSGCMLCFCFILFFLHFCTVLNYLLFFSESSHRPKYVAISLLNWTHLHILHDSGRPVCNLSRSETIQKLEFYDYDCDMTVQIFVDTTLRLCFPAGWYEGCNLDRCVSDCCHALWVHCSRHSGHHFGRRACKSFGDCQQWIPHQF